jgi:tetratricopeptide (TPR) repeat protein
MHPGRLIFVIFLPLFMGCGKEKKPIVKQAYIDSLISHYRKPPMALINDSVMLFWKNRIRPSLPGITSESKYAGTLSMRFHLFGDIRDIRTADSVLRKLDSNFNHKESQTALTLLSYSILQHRFREADVYLAAARKTGIKKYDALTSSFDVDFELGRYFQAENELRELGSSQDYGYFFRMSKMDHLKGSLDSSIHAMLAAASSEKNSPWLEQIALSNAADLYIHAGELEKAADIYQQCLALNGADFHSLTGLGWIALVHDQNDSLKK